MHLKIDNLTLQRGERVLVAGLSLLLPPGTACLVTGPNGAGKSTLLRCIAGLLPPAAGTVSWLQEGTAWQSEGLQERLHYVGHLEGLKGSLSVAENLGLGARLLGAPVEDRRLARIIAEEGLGSLASLPAAFLSAGQRRRAALARLALVPRPLWLLDEPTVTLDETARQRLEKGLAAHLGGGGSALVATHAPLAIGASLVTRLELGREARP